jgi:hypothetical protein
LFQGDQDIDIKLDIEHDVQKLCGKEVDYMDDKQQIEARELMDGGLGKQLSVKYQTTDRDALYGDYKLIILAAPLMSVGATIDAAEREVLGAVVPTVC